MINQELFEFHKSVVDWMTQNGISFIEAMGIVSLAHECDDILPVAFVNMKADQYKKLREEDESY